MVEKFMYECACGAQFHLEDDLLRHIAVYHEDKMTWRVPAEKSPPVPTDKYTGTPHYYKEDNQDLYDLFIGHFGIEAWLRHAEMEVIQYMWRAKKKEQYVTDLMKAKVIIERILKESSFG